MAETCEDCKHCPPKPEQHTPVWCPVTDEEYAWHSDGTAAKKFGRCESFAPKPPPPAEPATTCLECEHCPWLQAGGMVRCDASGWNVDGAGKRIAHSKWRCEHFAPKTTPPKTAHIHATLTCDTTDVISSFKRLNSAIRGDDIPTGKEATMTELTNEEKYPLQDWTDKPTCPACGRRRMTKPRVYEYGIIRSGNNANCKRADARYVVAQCRKCGQSVRMKYRADSPQACAHAGDHPRRRRAAWWLVKSPFRFVGWAVKHPRDAAFYVLGGLIVWNYPHEAWQVAAWAGNRLMELVG